MVDVRTSILCKGTVGVIRLFLFITLLGGCASYTDETRHIRESFRNQQYSDALAKLNESSLKEQTRNRLLFLLEKSMILDRLGQLKESRQALLAADKVVDELYTTSITKEAASYIYNESAQSYGGEDYEKVAIHTMLALSFIDDQDLNSALIEARRINTRLNEINNAYDEKKNRYAEDAFARYLAAMIYEAQSEWDSAIIDYRKAIEIYESSYKKDFNTFIPGDLIASLYRLYMKRGRKDEASQLRKEYPRLSLQLSKLDELGELIVIHELGTIAPKERNEFIIPWGREVLRFSFPVIRPKPTYRFSRTGVKSSTQSFTASQLAQNLDQIAAQTLEDRRLRLVLKQGARLVLKSQLTQQAEREFGPLGGLAGTIYGAVTETADTRGWTLLPSAFYVTRYQLSPGNHKIEIYTDGKLDRITQVKIKKGEIKFLRSRTG